MTHDRAAVYQDEDRQELQRIFEANVPITGLHSVLDAGCGYKLPIDVPREAHLTGLDSSQEALEKNQNADELILGDLQTFPLKRESYDAVICWWVLEHVPDRASSLRNLANSIRPGGLLVLGIPHIFSLKALLTRLTPFRFHVWVLKNFMGVPDAGKPGVEPYPTFLGADLAPKRIERELAAHGMTPVYRAAVRSGSDRALPTALRLVWNALAAALKAVTLGRWDPQLDEYVAIFRKSG